MGVPQPLIAIDQVLNTMVPPYKGPDKGWADETLSSRAHRMQTKSERWARFRLWVNRLFFWQVDHCLEAHQHELQRRQSPPEHRLSTESQK